VAGEAWAAAAADASAALGVAVAAHVIGPRREHIDVYDDWARLREVRESGCVLVRPDGYVAWRAHELLDDPAGELIRALASVLSRPVPGGAGPDRTA